MSELHRNQLKLHKAEEALNLARSISQRLDETHLTARVWTALGGLHLQAMRIEKARAAYLRALPMYEMEHDERLGLALLGLERYKVGTMTLSVQTFLKGLVVWMRPQTRRGLCSVFYVLRSMDYVLFSHP